jgi:hypothetical protein
MSGARDTKSLLVAFGFACASAVGTTAATAAATAEDIRDIRGPKAVGPAWLLAAIAAGAVALIAAAYAVWRYRRRRREPRVLLAHEIALARLDDCRRLMQPQTVKEYSIAVSDVVRQYIEARFDVTAAHRTTEEFLHGLLDAATGQLAAHRALLEIFLTQCDLAKFAGVALSLEGMEALHEGARAFVLETAKPAADPQPAHDPLPAT